MGGPLRRRIDHQHAALTAATHGRGRRFGRVVVRPEAIVRLRRLQVVEIDAEPLRLAAPGWCCAGSHRRWCRVAPPPARRARSSALIRPRLSPNSSRSTESPAVSPSGELPLTISSSGLATTSASVPLRHSIVVAKTPLSTSPVAMFDTVDVVGGGRPERAAVIELQLFEIAEGSTRVARLGVHRARCNRGDRAAQQCCDDGDRPGGRREGSHVHHA